LPLGNNVEPAAGTDVPFDRSSVPVMVADDARRIVAANAAACELLGTDRKALLACTIDGLTPPERLVDQEIRWAAFRSAGSQRGTFELLLPRGHRVTVEYSAFANVAPSRHLVILAPAPATVDSWEAHETPRRHLSEREREVLTRVAMGDSSLEIAGTLRIAPATVETHVRHCLAKLDARNRAHAITLGLQSGEITMDPDTPKP
jgi:DNA-binding CsgD family transcriptional regulator